MPVPEYTGSVLLMSEMEFGAAGTLAGPGAGDERS
jgi:hypothetical protein